MIKNDNINAILFSESVWQCFSSSCYHLNSLKTTKTYLDAEMYCKGIGGHVLALETEQESQDVRTMLNAPRGNKILMIINMTKREEKL